MLSIRVSDRIDFYKNLSSNIISNLAAFVSDAMQEEDVDRMAHREFLNFCEKTQTRKKDVVKDSVKAACFLIRWVSKTNFKEVHSK